MKLLWWTIAAALIALGLATVWLPVPTGVPLLALGALIVITTSRHAARALRNKRRSNPFLDRAFIWLEDRSPFQMSRILKRTRPRRGKVLDRHSG
jgi:hypothetical protein